MHRFAKELFSLVELSGRKCLSCELFACCSYGSYARKNVHNERLWCRRKFQSSSNSKYCYDPATKIGQKTENTETSENKDLHHLSGFVSEDQAKKMLNNLSDDDQKKLKVLKLEYEMWKHEGFKTPKTMPDSWWVKLLQIDSEVDRRSFYRHLKGKEVKLRLSSRKKGDALEQKKTESKEEHGPRIFTRINTTFQTHIQHARLAQSMMFGRPIIIDLKNESAMAQRELFKVTLDIMKEYGHNKKSPFPHDLILSNFNPRGYISKQLEYFCRDSPMKSLMAKYTEKDFLDLYPRKQLVYVTPRGDDLTHDDPDNIYVIGIGLSRHLTMTPEKAKQEGIRCVNIESLYWQCVRALEGAQSQPIITLSNRMKIILELMSTKDLNKAVVNIIQSNKKLYNVFKSNHAERLDVNSHMSQTEE